MLDTSMTVVLFGLMILSAIWLMILVRPYGPPRRFSRAPYGRIPGKVASAIRKTLRRTTTPMAKPPRADAEPDRKSDTA